MNKLLTYILSCIFLTGCQTTGTAPTTGNTVDITIIERKVKHPNVAVTENGTVIFTATE